MKLYRSDVHSIYVLVIDDSVCIAGRTDNRTEGNTAFVYKDVHRGILNDTTGKYYELQVPDNCVEMLSTLVYEFCKRIDSGKV